MERSQPTSRDTVRVLAALSDENRYRIVELLAAEQQELSCGAIGKALDISPSLLSHHLAILADAEIIGRRKNGLWTMNVLQRPVLKRQVAALRALIGAEEAAADEGGNGVTRLRTDNLSENGARPEPASGDRSSRSDEAVAGS